MECALCEKRLDAYFVKQIYGKSVLVCKDCSERIDEMRVIKPKKYRYLVEQLKTIK